MDDLEERIRAKAYELWVADGRPDGQHARHWDEAREIVALEDVGGEPTLPLDRTRDTPAEPALAQENQGEFPDLADQGEAAAGPEAARLRDTADRKPLTVEDAPKRSRGGRPKAGDRPPVSKGKARSAATDEGPAQPAAGTTEAPRSPRRRKDTR